MTVTYVVAYPHPEVPPEKRIRPFRANSAFHGTTLLERLGDLYLNHRGNLEDATLWKASRPTVAKLPPCPTSQASAVHYSVVYNESKAPVYEWIGRRENTPRFYRTRPWSDTPQMAHKSHRTLGRHCRSDPRKCVLVHTSVDLVDELCHSHRRHRAPRGSRREP